MNNIDTKEFCKRVVKYILLAVVVILAAVVLPNHTPDTQTAVSIGLVAAATFAILDMFAPNGPTMGDSY